MTMAAHAGKAFRLGLIAILAIFVGAGCGGSDDPNGETPKLECDGGAECDLPECGSDGDCEDGRCEAGACVPYECVDDSDCVGGTCEENACVPYECTSDEDCLDGTCEENACVPHECTSDEDCLDGTCEENACVPYECTSDEDCLDGTCEENACVPHECTSDEDCETGTCQENACILGPDCRVGVDIASIEEAVSRSECVTISLPSGTFEISNIPINRYVRIFGKGDTPTILDANTESRHFTIENGENLDLSYISLRNGSADIGGSILGKSNAELNILDSEIANNRASHEGGAIAFPSGGTIYIENSVIENNKVESIGPHAIKGGAISITNGDLSIDNTRFTNNGLQSHISEGSTIPVSERTNRGGAVYSRSTGSPVKIDISYTEFDSNWITQTNETSIGTDNFGAAIYAERADTNVTFSDFTGNSIHLDSSCMSCGARGGAIYQERGSFTSLRSNIKNNSIHTAYGSTLIQGGAMYMSNITSIDVQEGSVESNSVKNGANRSGGGMYIIQSISEVSPSEHKFIDVLFDGNSAVCEDGNCALGDMATGGALTYQITQGKVNLLLERVVGVNNRVEAVNVVTEGAFARMNIATNGSIHARIVNSTFSGNTSSSRATFLAFRPASRTLAVASEVELFNTTVRGEDGKTLFYLQANSQAEVEHALRLRNSILSTSGDRICDIVGAARIRFESAGWLVRPNVTNSCVPEPDPTDRIIDNPGLLPLADNGGNTLTHALQPGSTVINAGEQGGCTDGESPIEVDQRGSARTTPNCTPGAYGD